MRLLKIALPLLMGLALITAACTPAATPTPSPTPAPGGATPTVGTPGPLAVKENFRLLISDERNAIGDFSSLDVVIDRIGFQRGGEAGAWLELSPATAEVDLTKLQGDNAQEIWSGTLPDGQYSKVFIYISQVSGVLTKDGQRVDVKLPSSKLQISQPFEVAADSVVSFIYDLTVVAAGNQQSGIRYILSPQAGQSGASQPFTEVVPEVSGAPQPGLDLALEGETAAGQTVTVTVLGQGQPVQGATITVNSQEVGTSDEAGRVSFQLSEADEWEVRAVSGDLEGEITVTAAGAEAPAPTLELVLLTPAVAGRETTLRVLLNGQPVQDAVVSVGEEIVGVTGADGHLTIAVPAGAVDLRVQAVSGEATGSITVEVGTGG